jgi:hypothetical protein
MTAWMWGSMPDVDPVEARDHSTRASEGESTAVDKVLRLAELQEEHRQWAPLRRSTASGMDANAALTDAGLLHGAQKRAFEIEVEVELLREEIEDDRCHDHAD